MTKYVSTLNVSILCMHYYHYTDLLFGLCWELCLSISESELLVND